MILKKLGSRKLMLCVYDVGIFAIISLFFLWFSNIFGKMLVYSEPSLFLINTAIIFTVCMLSRFIFGIYSYILRYVQISVSIRLVLSDVAAGVIAVIPCGLIGRSVGVWHTGLVMMAFDIASILARLVYQYIYRQKNISVGNREKSLKAAIVGAGQLGVLLAEDLLCRKDSKYTPVCFMDKDTQKNGKRVLGMNVYPLSDKTKAVLKSLQVDEVFVAIPALSSEKAKELFEFFSAIGYTPKLYDAPVSDMTSGVKTREAKSEKRVIREFKIEDLLFRDQINAFSEEAESCYRGKTVLVTGGGGSIGSELCRQLAALKPAKLVIFDIYENNAYDIQQELGRKYQGELNLVVEIGSVRDVRRLDMVFSAHRPDIVFHAAAHKHVPLMESSAAEAIKNNVFGTYNTACAAERYGVKKFILISTDKAVNPTNVMGASKRLCEMIVQCRNDGDTEFVAVRFGNVLGSNGSVIPLFKAQIAEGGPITLTDKGIIRYFMTIPEASSLVMQAGAMAKKGELFVLDMGNPVKIHDLAINMIKLSGLEPGKDIEIKEIGLRPGEKLFEELLIKKELLTKTENKKIFIEKDKPLTRQQVEEKLAVLNKAIDEAETSGSAETIRAALKTVVDTYKDAAEVNARASEAEEIKKAQQNS